MKALKGIVFGFCVVLAACSRTPAVNTAAETAGPGEVGSRLTYEPSVPVNEGKKITLSFWTQVDQESIYRKLVDDYTAVHPNVQIELTAASYKDHFNKLLVALQSEMGPDIFHLHPAFNETLLPFLQPYPENALPKEALLAEFRQVDSHVIDGSIYYIDTGLMTSSIYYNTDMWQEAGLTDRDIPRTWDELREVAKKLTRFDAQGKMDRSGFNPNGIGFSLFAAMNLQQGVPLFHGKNPPVPVLDAAASEKSLRFLRGLYHTDKVADIRYPEAHESLGMGTAAMVYGWGWTNSWLRQHYPELKFDVFTIPAWTMEAPACFDRNNGESSMGVNRRSAKAKQDAAFDLIRFFLTRDDYLIEISRQFGVAPSKKSLMNHPSLKGDKLLSTFFNILDKTVWVDPFPDFYEATLTSSLIDPVIIDRVDIGTALVSTENRLTALFEEQYGGGKPAPR